MENGSRGPMLRKATAIDWVGDPFDVKGFDALHGESTFDRFVAHYEEYSPVNPVTGRREDRHRIPRALVGFNNALLVTGNQK